MRVVFALALVALASGQILRSANLEVVENSYIVVFHQNTTDEQINKHHAMLGEENKVGFKYNIGGEFKGYSVASASMNSMLAISEMAEVDFVEHDGMAYALDGGDQCESSTDSRSWGLPRVSNRNRVTSGPVVFYNGRQTDIYIIDTGINAAHTSYTRRFNTQFRFDSTGEGPGDQNGHGTHCAGTALGDSFGIAREAELYEVKVLGRSGGGTFAGVIAGIDWTSARPGQRKVGSLSLGGGFSSAVNNAVDAAVRAGSIMAVASGNSNANACNFSPASAPESICVNSMDNQDRRSSFSNFGTCTDIFAPGSSITSAWIGSATATNTISGTSMACPHVAGVAAAYWGEDNSASAAEIKAKVLGQATPNVITNPGTGSPNLLAYTCEE